MATRTVYINAQKANANKASLETSGLAAGQYIVDDALKKLDANIAAPSTIGQIQLNPQSTSSNVTNGLLVSSVTTNTTQTSVGIQAVLAKLTTNADLNSNYQTNPNIIQGSLTQIQTIGETLYKTLQSNITNSLINATVINTEISIPSFDLSIESNISSEIAGYFNNNITTYYQYYQDSVTVTLLDILKEIGKGFNETLSTNSLFDRVSIYQRFVSSLASPQSIIERGFSSVISDSISSISQISRELGKILTSTASTISSITLFFIAHLSLQDYSSIIEQFSTTTGFNRIIDDALNSIDFFTFQMPKVINDSVVTDSIISVIKLIASNLFSVVAAYSFPEASTSFIRAFIESGDYAISDYFLEDYVSVSIKVIDFVEVFKELQELLLNEFVSIIENITKDFSKALESLTEPFDSISMTAQYAREFIERNTPEQNYAEATYFESAYVESYSTIFLQVIDMISLQTGLSKLSSIITSSTQIILLSILRGVSDSIISSENIVRIFGSVRSITDPSATSSTQVFLLSLFRNIPDSIITSSTQIFSLNILRDISDSIITVSTPIRQYDVIRSVPDSVGTSDAFNSLVSVFTQFSDSAGSSDSPVRVYDAARIVNDSAPTVSSQIATVTYDRTATDSSNTVSSIISLLNIIRDFSDSTAIVENKTAILTYTEDNYTLVNYLVTANNYLAIPSPSNYTI